LWNLILLICPIRSFLEFTEHFARQNVCDAWLKSGSGVFEKRNLDLFEMSFLLDPRMLELLPITQITFPYVNYWSYGLFKCLFVHTYVSPTFLCIIPFCFCLVTLIIMYYAFCFGLSVTVIVKFPYLILIHLHIYIGSWSYFFCWWRLAYVLWGTKHK